MTSITIKSNPDSILIAGSENYYTKIGFKLNDNDLLKNYKINDGNIIPISASPWGDVNNVTLNFSGAIVGLNTLYVTNQLDVVTSFDFYLGDRGGNEPIFKNGDTLIKLISSDSFDTITNILTINKPITYEVDDLFILVMGVGRAGDSIILPEGWNILFEASGGNVYYGDLRVYYKFATSSEPNSYSFIESGIPQNGQSGIFMCLRNVDKNVPFSVYDYYSSNDASSTKVISPALGYPTRNEYQLRLYSLRNSSVVWTLESEEAFINEYVGSNRPQLLVTGKKEMIGTPMFATSSKAYRSSGATIALNAKESDNPEPPTEVGKILFNNNDMKSVVFNGIEYIRMMFNNNLIWDKGKKPESTTKVLIGNKGPYINTLIKADSSTKIEMKVNFTESGQYGIFGSRKGTNNTAFVWWYLNTQFRFDYLNESNKYFTDNPVKEEPYIIIKDGNKNFINGIEVTSNEDSIFDTNNDMTLFAIKSGTTVDERRAPMKLWYCKIWNNKVLVRDYIPVAANDIVEGMIAPSNCLFDKISKTFFENEGTGIFTVENNER